MIRLLWLLAIAAVVWRMATGRWPWEQSGRRVRSNDVAQACALLGVGRGASHAEIIEAHRRLVAMVHPDRGGTNEQVHEANAARDLLLASLAAR